MWATLSNLRSAGFDVAESNVLLRALYSWNDELTGRALRLEAPRRCSVVSLLRGAREAASEGMWHASVPFQQIVNELLPRRAFDA